eukprot:CAMPEP_0174891346 /NCGR_PEP_ID=MMETSP0167-20121228/6412_1 /TAXON_ID=38298 /ORGANISM="Rhodella maculata, Strain CCMP736" /LENGTH=93 /DNA_ID=CAMNT_0016129467 /DNA_START=787 /DNA_END=1064 /DNA_ORIENTATION=+
MNDIYIAESLALWDTGAPYCIVGEKWLNTYSNKLRLVNPDMDHLMYDTSPLEAYGFCADMMRSPLAKVTFPVHVGGRILTIEAKLNKEKVHLL